MNKKLIALAILAALIGTALIAHLVSAQWVGYTFWVQDQDARNVRNATVFVVNHSGQMTDSGGKAYFNLDPMEFPITVLTEAPGYNETTSIFTDSSTLTFKITINSTEDPGDAVRRAGSACCGVGLIVSAAVICCFAVGVRKIPVEPEDEDDF